ncbi:MAG: hypothetical protein LDLANPLL_00455 [Turneriella sp.]|nr:hypothetical protein [Turneriella sp.]
MRSNERQPLVGQCPIKHNLENQIHIQPNTKAVATQRQREPVGFCVGRDLHETRLLVASSLPLLRQMVLQGCDTDVVGLTISRLRQATGLKAFYVRCIKFGLGHA